MHLAGPVEASNVADGDELQSNDESDADQQQPARVQSDGSEDELPKPKKQTAQKGKKHMTRLYSPDPPSIAAQLPRNTLRKSSRVRCSLCRHAWHVIPIRDSS